jgi:nucleoid DNA-binding protein
MSAIKDDLISAVQAALVVENLVANKKETEQYIEAVLNGLLNVCKEKESVRTKLGTFRWANTPARDRINPRTGEPVSVEAYSTLKFKVAKAIRVLESEKKPAKKAAAPKAAAPKAAAPKATATATKPVAKKPVAKK